MSMVNQTEFEADVDAIREKHNLGSIIVAALQGESVVILASGPLKDLQTISKTLKDQIDAEERREIGKKLLS
jgi:hypothetical protein